ncbi:RnfABCDGE type electron transport complex subunit D [Chloroflexota bacterium]
MTTPEQQFIASPSPHLWRGQSVSKIMYIVALALLLPTGAGIYFFGYRALLVILVSTITAVITEYLVKKLRGKPFIMDGSAVVTGLLLALTLPSTLPLWMVAIGSIFSIAIIKEAFGGLGHNIFNPALGGRAFLTACFSVKMTSWVAPMGFSADAVTTATPLNSSFIGEGSNLSLYKEMFLGNIGGSLGETSALMILIGGILLLLLGIINWRIPVFYIGTVALFALVLGQDAIYHVLAGGLLLGAFFMATDYVTSPITPRGRIIFAVGAGILTIVIRQFGGLPGGVCYSILFMNAVTPLIDRYVKVRPYGLVKKEKGES